MSKITNIDVEKICQLLISFNGDIDKVLNHMRYECKDLNRDIIKSIKYKMNWKHISDRYFDKNEFRTFLNDEEVAWICESLVKNDGDIRKVQEELKESLPKLTYKCIQGIRLKNSHKRISDKYFNKERFLNHEQRYDHPKGDSSPRAKISEKDVEVICDVLIKNFGDCNNSYKYINKYYKRGIISLKTINSIKYKDSWKHVSDKYFTKAYLQDLKNRKVQLICETLINNNFDVNRTLGNLKDKIPFINARFIRDIKNGHRYSDISNKYFCTNNKNGDGALCPVFHVIFIRL